MHNLDHPSRREFVQRAAATIGMIGASNMSRLSALGAAGTRQRPKPDAVLNQLLDGNKRFVEGKLLHPGRAPKDFLALAEGQAPLAVIVGCADSRVAPELIFDQGIGELFVVRIAGNVVSGAGATVKGSIEYAVAELGARLIMVLGHSDCGAVKSAVKHIDANDPLPGAINDVVGALKPAVAKIRSEPGDPLENAIKANVRVGVDRLKNLEPLLAAPTRAGKLKIVGGVYDLRSGGVEIVAK